MLKDSSRKTLCSSAQFVRTL
jgi:hypothetical protein